MERLVVTRTRNGLWSVSHDGELSATFARAAERRCAGINVVVVVTHAHKTPKA